MSSRRQTDDQETISGRKATAMTDALDLGSWGTTCELGIVTFPKKWKIITWM